MTLAQEQPNSLMPSGIGLEEIVDQVCLIRAVEKRLLSLFSEGKLFGTTHTCIGQELCAVAVVSALDRAKDIVFSPHRCHGHFLAYADDPELLIAEIMGRENGVCGGRGGSQHLCYRNFHSNGVQGGIVPVSTGMALAEKFKGSGAIGVCFLGDGTTGEGVLYETFNLATLWKIPILYVLEHNGYAQSTPTDLTISGDLSGRASAFGIEVDERDAVDAVALVAHMSTVVDHVRRDRVPFLQVLYTHRMAAHSKGDDNRTADELAHARQHDPLVDLAKLVGSDLIDKARTEAELRVDAAVERATKRRFLSVDAALEETRLAKGPSADAREALAPVSDQPELVVHNLNQALHHLMANAKDVVLLGEDVADPYGGAFKVTRGLSTAFPKRVLATPISEAAIVGVSAGLSMRGIRSVVEIMFGDFLTLCADQIVNHLAKFRWMYNEQVRTPVVIRAAVGGHRGYGPTHSQSLEKMFFGVPGLVVVAPSARHNPGELLRRAVLLDDRPVIFIEQKVLYSKRLLSRPPLGLKLDVGDSSNDGLYPTAIWKPVGLSGDLTIVTYGAMTEFVEEAMAESFATDEVVAEYVVPSVLAPLHLEPIVESVRRTGRLLIVEEGTGPWGFGAEVVARVVEDKSTGAVSCARVAARHLPIPSARPAEEQVLPDVKRIVAEMRRLTS